MSKVDSVKTAIENKHPTFYDAVFAMSLSEMQASLLLHSKYLQETLVLLKTSEAILKAEAAKTAAEKPYREKIKECKSTIKQIKGLVDKGVCVPDLESQMIRYTQLVEEQKFAMDNDPAVKDAKDNLTITKGPVTEAKGIYELKISYLHISMNEKQGFEAHESTEETESEEKES